MLDFRPFVKQLREHMRYESPPGRPALLSRLPGGSALALYGDFIYQVSKCAREARRGGPREEWLQRGCYAVVRGVEWVGGTIQVEGLQHLADLDGPAVIIGNHMSTLETVSLPAFMLPFNDASFVVKESLLTYPFFGPVMRAIDPVAVGRVNPREDLATVFRSGMEKIAAGRSVVIFPQSTRSVTFRPAAFNSLGVKLAKRAKVPVIPLALKTDMWGNGSLIKDFGPVRRDEPVRITFGPPMTVEGTGKAQHDAVVAFIERHLRDWGVPIDDAEDTPAKDE